VSAEPCVPANDTVQDDPLRHDNVAGVVAEVGVHPVPDTASAMPGGVLFI
jgi:hypothetical protein